MAEDRESSDRKHEKSKKRDRRTKKVDPKVWTEQEKMQLAEAIEMYGVNDVNRVASRVPTKKPHLVGQMLRQLHVTYRKEAECQDIKRPTFVDLSKLDDLFVAGGTKPRDVMVKWMDYLDTFYGKDSLHFKMLTRSFLVMSECTPPSVAIMRTTTTAPLVPGQPSQDGEIDFRKVYYFLYRVFNNYCVTRTYKDPVMTKYLHELFLRVLDEIEYTSDGEKMAMHQIVSNWTSVNRVQSLRVYGKVTPKVEPGIDDETDEDVKPNLKNLRNIEFKVLEQPMIPNFNPLHLRSNQSNLGS